MQAGGILIAIDLVAREATLFAALCFFIGGIDDLLVDLAYGLGRIGRRRPDSAILHLPVPPGRIAIFVAAWDESAVIGAMLRNALARFDHPDYQLYVGTYPNDPATIEAVAAVAAGDPRIRLVIGPLPGPTTKAGCLNSLWHALRRDEAQAGRPVIAVVLHDAEDMVHPLELRVFAHHLVDHAAVQIPVLPLPHPRSRFVSGHYLDEFAEQHAKVLVVRQALGAAIPFAGVGCAIRRDYLGRLAEARGGEPFDAGSLTEDYELGLAIAAMGGRTMLARVPEAPGGPPVAVRAYFPDTLEAAVRQKARWMTGIALAGWDRTGWSRAGHIGDHWMRTRDRRATLAMPVLALAYAALLLWAASYLGHLATHTRAADLNPLVATLLWANLALVAWRLVVRALFVRHAYGWREAAWSIPRIAASNIVALLAARRALFIYLRLLRGAKLHWDKTAHQFPDQTGSAAA